MQLEPRPGKVPGSSCTSRAGERQNLGRLPRPPDPGSPSPLAQPAWPSGSPWCSTPARSTRSTNLAHHGHRAMSRKAPQGYHSAWTMGQTLPRSRFLAERSPLFKVRLWSGNSHPDSSQIKWTASFQAGAGPLQLQIPPVSLLGPFLLPRCKDSAPTTGCLTLRLMPEADRLS